MTKHKVWYSIGDHVRLVLVSHKRNRVYAFVADKGAEITLDPKLVKEVWINNKKEWVNEGQN